MDKYLDNHSFENLQNLSKILGKNLIFVDLEATGFVHEKQFSIIEIGLVCISPEKVLETCTFVDPRMKIPYHITQLTGITDSMVRGYPTFEKYLDYFQKISKNSILMGWNSKGFDSKGLEKMGKMYGREYTFTNQLDTRYFFLRDRNQRLNLKTMGGNLMDAARFHEIELKGTAHRAGYDIAVTALIAESVLRNNGLQAVREDVEKLQCVVTKGKYTQFINTLKVEV